GIGTVERHASEELGGHAPALADVVAATARTGAGGVRRTQRGEQLAAAPDAGETAGLADVAGLELVVEDERTGVDVADRIDQAHHAAGAAHVEAGERFAERVQVEERVPGEHVVPVREEPLIDLVLLVMARSQRVPA